jgi:hypothetical protein
MDTVAPAAISAVRRYSAGMEFEVTDVSEEPDPDDARWYRHPRSRFGVGWPDGTKLLPDDYDFDENESQPTGPTLTKCGGGGSGGLHRHRFWLWPLPAEGWLQLAIDWPEESVPEVVVDVTVR